MFVYTILYNQITGIYLKAFTGIKIKAFYLQDVLSKMFPQHGIESLEKI